MPCVTEEVVARYVLVMVYPIREEDGSLTHLLHTLRGEERPLEVVEKVLEEAEGGREDEDEEEDEEDDEEDDEEKEEEEGSHAAMDSDSAATPVAPPAPASAPSPPTPASLFPPVPPPQPKAKAAAAAHTPRSGQVAEQQLPAECPASAARQQGRTCGVGRVAGNYRASFM